MSKPTKAQLRELAAIYPAMPPSPDVLLTVVDDFMTKEERNLLFVRMIATTRRHAHRRFTSKIMYKRLSVRRRYRKGSRRERRSQ